MEENKKVITGMSTVLTNGTLSNEIPFGVTSENVELENKETLADVFDNNGTTLLDVESNVPYGEGSLNGPLIEGRIYKVQIGPYIFENIKAIEGSIEGLKFVYIGANPIEQDFSEYPFSGITVSGMSRLAVEESEAYPIETFPARFFVEEQNFTIKEKYIPKEQIETISIQGSTFDEIKTQFDGYWTNRVQELVDQGTGEEEAFNIVCMEAFAGWEPSNNTKPHFEICLGFNTYFDFFGKANTSYLESGMNDNSTYCFYTSPRSMGPWHGEYENDTVYVEMITVHTALGELPYLLRHQTIALTGEQSSWLISNPEHQRYIQDRPFYSDDLIDYIIIPWGQKMYEVARDHTSWFCEAKIDLKPNTQYYFGPNENPEDNEIVTTSEEGTLSLKYGTVDVLIAREGAYWKLSFGGTFADDYSSGSTYSIREVNPYIKKLDPKFLPDGYGASDWEQNDETAADYIKNRTHYIKENTAQTVIENVSMTASYMEDNLHSYNGLSKGAHFEPASPQSIPELENLQPGQTYSVVLDEKHVCTGILKDITEEMAETMPIVEVNCAYFLGNGAILNFGSSEGYETSIPGITNFDTGENFAILIITATMGTTTMTNFAGTYLGLDYETLLENGINDKTLSVAIKEVDNSYSKLDMNYLPNSLVREWLPYKEYYKDTPVHKDGSIYKALETFVEGSEISTVKGSIGEVTPTEGMQIRGEGVIRPDCSFFENISDADLFNYITADGFAVPASEAVEDDMEVGISLATFPYHFHKIFDSSMGRFVHMISSREDDLQDIILCIPNEYITESGKISIAVFLDETILISYVLYVIMMQDVVWDENRQFVSGTRVPTEYIEEGFGVSFKTNDFVVDTITSVSDHFSDTFKILKTVQDPKWELFYTHFIDGQFNEDEIIQYYDNVLNTKDSGYETARAKVKPGSIIFNTKGGYKNVHFSISLGRDGES